MMGQMFVEVQETSCWSMLLRQTEKVWHLPLQWLCVLPKASHDPAALSSFLANMVTGLNFRPGSEEATSVDPDPVKAVPGHALS